jgi:carbonic anhydrase
MSDRTVASRLAAVEKPSDIPPEMRDTPIGLFLEYHNLGRPFDVYERAQMLIGMCMDSRKHLRIPDNFAFIIRSGGANLRYADFKVSYTIGVGGVRAIALVGHTNCGMCRLMDRRDQFVNGMVENAGWERQRAMDHFNAFAPMFEIGNEIDFVVEEAERLNRRYPKIPVVPMIYKVEDNRLYLVKGAEVLA